MASWLLPVLVVGYAVTLVPGVRGPEPVFVPWLEIGLGDGIVAAAGLLCVARAAVEPRARAAWALLGAGPLLYVLGDLVYYAFLQGLADPPYPSLADAAWLGLYPLLTVGLVLLVRSTMHGVRTSLWLDGLTGGFGAAAVLGALLLRPVLEVTGGSLPTVLTNLAYPVGDLGLLTVLMLVFHLHGWRVDRTWWLLAWVVGTLLVVDVVYLLQASAGTYVDGGLLDVGWCLAFGPLGLAAWSRPGERAEVREGGASLIVPATLSALSTVVLFAGALRALPFVVCLFGLLAVLIGSLRLFLAVVESRRLARARLEARTDELTDLPNRRRFLEVLRDLLDSDTAASVMLVDLDRFKHINDSLGHGVGDRLLQVIGSRLRARVRGHDTLVARLGGDEFAVVVTDPDETVAFTVAALLREVIAEPVVLSGVTLSVDASIGIACAPAHGSTWESLLAKADAAMYAAKRGGTGVEFYVESRDETGSDRLALLADLRDALRDGDLRLHYQPVYSADEQVVCSLESLVRWPHPTRGMLAPGEFLPVAVEAGLSRRLTDEVLRIVTRQAASWQTAGIAVPVAVNLSEADLTDPALADRVTGACARAGLPAELLQLEITESVTSAVAETAIPVLSLLRGRGHQVLLDDFGTGYSSLSFLRILPLDAVKLDRSFLTDVDDPSARAIVTSTVQMAHALGLRIIAEGVETSGALRTVRQLGCDAVQGFFTHRPAPADQVTATLQLGTVGFAVPRLEGTSAP